MQIDNISFTSPMAQPQRFGPNNPPFIPQIQSAHPSVAPYVPLLASLTADTLTVNMSENPHAGRVFLFNQCIQNNYQNVVFGTAVAMAADYLLYAMARGECPNPEAGAQTAVSRALGIIGAQNILRYQQLQGSLHPSIINDARSLLGGAQQIQQEINQIKAKTVTNIQPQNMYISGNAPMQHMNPQYSTGYATTGQPQMQQPMYGGMHQMPAVHPQYQTPAQTPQSSMFAPTHVAATTPPPKQYQNNPPEATKVEKLVWLPSNLQAYPHAYLADSEEMQLLGAIDPLSSKQCVIFQINKKEVSEMDRSKHQLTPLQSSLIPNNIPPQARAEKLQSSLTEQAKAIADSDVVGNLNNNSTVHEGTKLATTLHEAIFNTQYALHNKYHGKVYGKTYTCNHILAHVNATTHNFRTLVEEVASCRTFAAVASIMHGAITKNAGNQSMANFIKILNDHMTKELNNFVLTKMCVDVTLGSFMDDSMDLENYLTNQRGKIYGDSIAEMQQFIIDSAVGFLEPSLEEDMLAQIVDIPEVVEGDQPERVYATMFTQFISVTAIGVNSAELNLGLMSKMPNLLNADKFSGLNSLTKSLFKSTDKTNMTYSHHYIVTSDKKVFELHRGVIGHGTYLISEVN